MKFRKYRLCLIILIIGTVLAAGYLTFAQEREGIARPQGEQSGEAQSDESAALQSKGVAGQATEAVIVNFSKLASRERLSPAPYKEPKVIREPGPGPRHKPVPVEEGAVLQAQGSEDYDVTTKVLPPSPAAASSFKAIEDNNASIPPDTHGAVGPNHLMTVLNTQIRIQTRTGVSVSTVSTDSFWASLPGPWASTSGPATFDPKVLYDPYSNRWMFTSVADGDETTSAVLIAVSLTSDPTGNWKLFKVDTDSTNLAWADYPSLGFNKNWIVVTVNMFDIATGNFKRENIYAFNKAALYAGTAPFKLFTDTTGGFTMAPAITYDNALNTLYLVEDWSATQLRISSITGTAAAPAYSASHLFPTAPASSAWSDSPPNGDDFAPQLGSTRKIQVNDARVQNAVYRNGSLWCAHTIFLPNGATPTRSAVQWWELAPTGAVKQRGRIEDTAGQKFYAFPSITVNKNSDVLVGYSRFSSQQYAGANYSFRAASDPVNTTRTEAVLKAGSAPYDKDFGKGRNRWGDYSSTVVDPLNDLDMWTIQEHATAASGGFSRWGTWWGRIGPSTPNPLIQLGVITATDGGTDTDTAVEPGEGSNKLTIQLKNTGSGAVTAVSAKLTTTTPGVTITTDTSAYPNLAATTGVGNNTTPFVFDVASNVPCATLLSFTLTVTYTGGGSPIALSFTVPTGTSGAVVTKSRTGAAVAIPDNSDAGVNIPFAVSGFTGKIADLNFRFDGTSCSVIEGSTTVGLDHTWVGDLVVTLKSPQGTIVTLMNQPGGVNNSGHNFCNTLLDDESTGISIQNIADTQAPFTGSFKPTSPLSAFDGQNPNGTWTLNVSDRGAVDTGNVRAFSLIITPLDCVTTATPIIQLGTVTPTDNGGDPDTLIESGEGGKLTVQLKNAGGLAATAVSAKLTTTTPGVTITTNTSAYPNLAAATGVGNNTTPFAFTVASTVPCGQIINFTLTVTYTGGGSPKVLNFTIPTGKAGALVTKPRTGAAVAIPDNNATGASVPLVVSGFTGRIADLNFKFDGTSCSATAGSTTVGLDHAWVGNLVVTLKSPQGTIVTLMTQPGGPSNDGNNFCNTTLDDESAGVSIQNVTAAQNPYTGSFKPSNPLSAFDGQDPNGTWTLNVSDRAALNTGNVRAFSLIITPYACSTTASVTPLEVQSDSALASLPSSGGASAHAPFEAMPKEQNLTALLAGDWPTFGQTEDDILRSAFMPKRYDNLLKLLSG